MDNLFIILRLLQKQAEALETLKSEILILNSSVTAYMLSAPKINNLDDDISSSDAINLKRNKISNKSTEVPSFVYYDDYDMRSDNDNTARQPKKDFSKKEILDKNAQPLSTSSNKLEEVVEREEDKVNIFFSKVANLISPPDSSNNNNNNNGSNDNYITDDNDDMIDEDKTIRKTKIGSAQQKRLKFARTSGKAIRTVGRNIMKSASDALGFWVGLGFDEIELDGEKDIDIEIVDENDIDFIQERSNMNTNQFYTSLPPSIPDIIDIQAKENEKLRLMTENDSIEVVESAPRKVLKSPFYVQNSIKKDGIVS